MTTNNSALASLTATYTDSENEDDQISDGDETHSEGSSETPTTLPPVASLSTTPTKPAPVVLAPISAIPRPTKGNLRLVSYNDDLVISDEENNSPNRETINMDISEDEGEEAESAFNKEQTEKDQESKRKAADKFSEYGFSLPAEPKGKCPAELQDKIEKMYEKMKSGMDMNKLIQERKEFRNPSIYEKLIQFCDINELGTNYPPEIYDPLQWGKDSYYEELAKVQKVEMEKREKERKEHMKQDQVLAAAKKAEEESKKRKSKWDQPAPGAVAVTAPQTAAAVAAAAAAAKSASNVVQATFTTNVTGTKGTVISAFGSLPKKPKA